MYIPGVNLLLPFGEYHYRYSLMHLYIEKGGYIHARMTHEWVNGEQADRYILK